MPTTHHLVLYVRFETILGYGVEHSKEPSVIWDIARVWNEFRHKGIGREPYEFLEHGESEVSSFLFRQRYPGRVFASSGRLDCRNRFRDHDEE